jgi:AcrR family transcriptional regulator
MARAGGPDAVALREATRAVGVVPNAAYRHFANRDELLAAVCTEAMRELSNRVAEAVAEVPGEYGNTDAAIERLAAIGTAYVKFARDEPGLFATAFSVPNQHGYSTFPDEQRTALGQVRVALDELVAAGFLDARRRTDLEFPIWATVHGLAVLAEQGPLRDLPEGDRQNLLDRILIFIGEGLAPA